MEWISVKDRLPNRNDFDLICYNENDLNFGSFLCDYGDVTTYKPYKITLCFYQESYQYGEHVGNDRVDVTHWMPLPNPPVEKV